MNLNTPNHIAIILDGNRRWATRLGLSPLKGHAKGILNVKKIILHAHKLGIKILTVYAFSTENWNRSKEEVDSLMSIFEKFIDQNIEKFHKKGIRLVHLGKLEGFPSSLAKKIKKSVEQTKHNKEMIFQMALNYGGRDEIKRAIQNIVSKNIKVSDITDEMISKNLDTCGLPDPDLIIRTSGEQRLSGFLLWQSAYSELYFTKVNWPEFDEVELEKAILDYSKRQRRHGK